MKIITTDQQTKVTTGTNQGTLLCKMQFNGPSCVNMPNLQQGMKAIGFKLEDEDASQVNHEDFMRGVIAKFGPGVSFVTWKVILNRIVHNFGMLWQTSSIQGMRKLYRV